MCAFLSKGYSRANKQFETQTFAVVGRRINGVGVDQTKKGEEPNVFKTIESFVLNNDRTNTNGCFKVTMFSLSLIA